MSVTIPTINNKPGTPAPMTRPYLAPLVSPARIGKRKRYEIGDYTYADVDWGTNLFWASFNFVNAT